MTGQHDIKNIVGVSNEAVLKATGYTWDEWTVFLDDQNASSLTHKEIVQLLAKKINKSWWCQKIANGYEREKGLRTLGETAGTGFQIGVSKTFHLDKDALWHLISSPEGMHIWLGDTIDIINIDNQAYETKDGTKGKITVLKPGSHFRMTWQPKSWTKPSVLQVRVVGKGQKSVLTFHQEKLPNQSERENMKFYWTDKINQLLKMLNDN